jgi:hypothetical protein
MPQNLDRLEDLCKMEDPFAQTKDPFALRNKILLM